MLKKDFHHSASSANAFIDSPAYWIITKLYGFEGPPNNRMIMGTAAEHGAYEGLSKSLDDKHITKETKKKYIEEGGDPDQKELEMAEQISIKFKEALAEFGEVVNYQKETITTPEKFGLKYPVRCITDFEFNDVIVDTKATAYLKRLKKGTLDPNWYPKKSDVRQQMLYARVNNKPTMLLYTSAADQEAIDMVDRGEEPLNEIISAFRSIEHIVSIAKTKEDVVRMFPLNFENFRWGKTEDEPSRVFARKIWQDAWK